MGLFVLLASFLAFTPDAAAQDIGTERTIGLGVQLGSPTGLTGKYYFAGPEHAVVAGLAAEFIGFADDRLTGYLAYLYHPVTIASGAFASVPLYVGVGPQIWSADLGDDVSDFDDDAAFGLRIPVGLDVNMNNLPIQISGGVAALLPVVPDITLGIDISVAARYYF